MQASTKMANILQMTLLNAYFMIEYICILFQILFKFVPHGLFDNNGITAQ